MNSSLLRVISFFSFLSVVVVFSVFIFLIGFLFWNGIPTLGLDLLFGDVPPLDAFFGLKPVWDGLWPAIVGTLELVILTGCIVILPGVGCGVFLAEYALESQRLYIGTFIDILAGMPSIVMGLFGFTLIIFLRNTCFLDVNTGLLLAAVCLAILVLPVLIMTTQEALMAVSRDLRLTAYALGYTQEQFFLYIQLPYAARGIWSGLVLALSRAAEDTAVILLTGVVVNVGLPSGLSSKFEALPFAIYYTATQYQTQAELNKGFGAATILLILVVGLFFIAQLLSAHFYRLRKSL